MWVNNTLRLRPHSANFAGAARPQRYGQGPPTPQPHRRIWLVFAVYVDWHGACKDGGGTGTDNTSPQFKSTRLKTARLGNTRMENTSYISLSRQMVMHHQMDVIANNLANMTTPGFKSERATFAEQLQSVTADEELSFVQNRAVLRDPSPGVLERTGNPLDVAINGKGYVFRGQTPGVAGKVFQACGVALPPVMRSC